MRRAITADAMRLWQWRNDATTRANSLSANEIPWEQHQTWLSSRLADPHVLLYIAEDAAVPVASVRFERHAERSAFVHIVVDPELRNRGYGSDALRLTVEELRRTTDLEQIEAIVRPANSASLRTLAKAGFIPVGRSVSNGVECDHLRLTLSQIRRSKSED